MIKPIGFFILSLTLLASGMAMAHSGKVHVMGAITAIHDQHLEVKTKEGSVKSILLTDKTIFQRGQTRIKGSEIKIGERVVVHATPGKDGTLTADEVHLGAATTKATSSHGPALSGPKGHALTTPVKH